METDSINNESLQHYTQNDLSMIHNESFEWRKPILVVGKPGSGKTETICQIVRYFVHKQKMFLFQHQLDF